jgi:hypothetical protein
LKAVPEEFTEDGTNTQTTHSGAHARGQPIADDAADAFLRRLDAILDNADWDTSPLLPCNGVHPLNGHTSGGAADYGLLENRLEGLLAHTDDFSEKSAKSAAGFEIQKGTSELMVR